MKHKLILLILIASTMFSLSSCNNEPATDLTQTSFIPVPTSVAATGGSIRIDNIRTIYFENDKEGLQQTARYLAEALADITGTAPQIEAVQDLPMEGIYLSISESDQSLGNEGYTLTIGKQLISVDANGVAGCFYGIQTLLQTMPVGAATGDPIQVATGTVRDFPEFGYRGAMLDVSRHFFRVEDVKRYIDLLALYKMNALHLHLSDDQGWRIEIKSWPKLTEIGGSTQVGGGDGGYYTQEQYSDLVNYARERHITIVPEIDMPGHTNAALASYPELNCDNKAPELYTGIEVGFSTLCTRKEVTYQFVDDVVREISGLTPGPLFHIGGDESHVTAHDDYVYFVNRVQKIVDNYGKRVVGWDEIANANLIDDAVVQFWADVENTTMGVEQGAKVIMSPAKKAYLDMKYDSTTHLGLNWAGFIEVDTAYAWNPATYVQGITKENILGIEAPLWTETITNIDELEYMVFPRLPGYAEIGWSSPEQRNWEEYKNRLAQHGKRFEALGIDFYRSERVPWP